MRVAVTYENGQIFQHFGHTEQFKVYNIEDNKIVNTQVVDTNGQGHGALAGFLNSAGIDVLICGGIGGGAQTALAAAGIQLFGGVSGDADEAVKSYIEGKLAYILMCIVHITIMKKAIHVGNIIAARTSMDVLGTINRIIPNNRMPLYIAK